MINILLVEDDEDKREQIMSFIDKRLQSNLTEVRSFQSGLKALKTNIYDIILLDMTMPTFDISSSEPGGRSQPFGGELLLFEMARRGIKTKAIVITQFDLFGEGEEEISLKDLDVRLMSQFEDNYAGAIQYSISYTSWEDVLYDKITNILK